MKYAKFYANKAWFNVVIRVVNDVYVLAQVLHDFSRVIIANTIPTIITLVILFVISDEVITQFIVVAVLFITITMIG